MSFTSYQLFNLHKVKIYHDCDKHIREKYPDRNETVYLSGAVNLVEFIQAMFGREMELTELSSIIESFIAILQQQGIMRKEDVDLGSTQPEEIFITPHNLYILLILLFDIAGIMLSKWIVDAETEKLHQWRYDIHHRAHMKKDTFSDLNTAEDVLLDMEQAILAVQPFIEDEAIFNRIAMQHQKNVEGAHAEPLFAKYLLNSFKDLANSEIGQESRSNAVLQEQDEGVTLVHNEIISAERRSQLEAELLAEELHSVSIIDTRASKKPSSKKKKNKKKLQTNPEKSTMKVQEEPWLLKKPTSTLSHLNSYITSEPELWV